MDSKSIQENLSSSLNWGNITTQLMLDDAKPWTSTSLSREERIVRAASKQEMRERALASLPASEREEFLNAFKILSIGVEQQNDKKRKEVAKVVRLAKPSLNPLLIKLKAKESIGISSFISCQQMQEEIILRIKAAKHFNIHPAHLTSDLKQRYQEELANRVAEELLKEPKMLSRKSKAAKSSRKKMRGRKSKAIPTPKTEISTEQKVILQLPKIEKNLFNVKTKENVIEHKRVTLRWQSKNVDELRKISDVVNGSLIQRYALMEEAALLEQRWFHYLPGLEQVIAYPEVREKFAFTTDRGYGVVAQITTPAKIYEGVIYLGVETSESGGKNEHKIYHKYFEQFNQVDQIFSDQKFAEKLSKGEDEEDWKPVGEYSMNALSNGCLEVLFANEEHKVVIYPLD